MIAHSILDWDFHTWLIIAIITLLVRYDQAVTCISVEDVGANMKFVLTEYVNYTSVSNNHISRNLFCAG